MNHLTQTAQCPDCNGYGNVTKEDGSHVECCRCDGYGKLVWEITERTFEEIRMEIEGDGV